MRNTPNLSKRLESLENVIASLTSVGGVCEHAVEQRCRLHDISPIRAVPVSASQADNARRAPVAGSSQLSQARMLSIVEAVIASRRQRLKFFENDFFFDPSWAMLLDLFRAELRQQPISVSSVCYGSGVPETTALRYIKYMEDGGYLTRKPDPTDKRRVFLHLTPMACEKLIAYLNLIESDFSITVRRG